MTEEQLNKLIESVKNFKDEIIHELVELQASTEKIEKELQDIKSDLAG